MFIPTHERKRWLLSITNRPIMSGSRRIKGTSSVKISLELLRPLPPGNLMSGKSLCLFVFAVAFLSAPAFAQPAADIVIEHNVAMKTRDGVLLKADVYRPTGDGSFPLLLERTPYNKDNGADFARQAVAHGFMVVIQDVRGRYTSEGDWYTFKHEMDDGDDTVQWAAALPHANGKVGLFGGSYVGATVMLAAITHPPHLPRGHSLELPRKLDIPGRLDWLAHPTYDSYWKQWSIEENYQNVQVPSLTVAAWYELFQDGSLRNYIGLTAHAGNPAARDGAHLLIAIGGHSDSAGGAKIGGLKPDFVMVCGTGARRLAQRCYIGNWKSAERVDRPKEIRRIALVQVLASFRL
jgi:predicted acyl esterase